MTAAAGLSRNRRTAVRQGNALTSTRDLGGRARLLGAAVDIPGAPVVVYGLRSAAGGLSGERRRVRAPFLESVASLLQAGWRKLARPPRLERGTPGQSGTSKSGAGSAPPHDCGPMLTDSW